MSIRIAVNGLGRIGRLVIRALMERESTNIELVAINGTRSIEEHIHLLKYDSTHGIFAGDISKATDGEKNFIEFANKNRKVKALFMTERDPALLPWKDLNIDIVIECTGKFNKRDLSAKHLDSGAKRVLVSAPCDNADATIVYGVNNEVYNDSQKVISIGSCTTNALAPIAKILDDALGIEKGFMTTIHSVTNDQSLLDASHKDPRRARSAYDSIIPSSTGAAKALKLVLPNLAGKVDGSAVRVPTSNVSMIDLTFLSKKETTKEEINALMLAKSKAEFKGVLEVAPAQLVSVDFKHNPHSSIFDPFETSVTAGNFVRVISWYDNEWGFSERLLDVTEYIAKK